MKLLRIFWKKRPLTGEEFMEILNRGKEPEIVEEPQAAEEPVITKKSETIEEPEKQKNQRSQEEMNDNIVL